jgi:hypothetical protein
VARPDACFESKKRTLRPIFAEIRSTRQERTWAWASYSLTGTVSNQSMIEVITGPPYPVPERLSLFWKFFSA